MYYFLKKMKAKVKGVKKLSFRLADKSFTWNASEDLMKELEVEIISFSKTRTYHSIEEFKKDKEKSCGKQSYVETASNQPGNSALFGGRETATSSSGLASSANPKPASSGGLFGGLLAQPAPAL